MNQDRMRGQSVRFFSLLAKTSAVLALSVLGCSDEDDAADPGKMADERKVYLSELYGYAVTFDEREEEAVGYAVVDGACWTQPIPQEIWWVSQRDDERLDFDYLGQKQPPIVFERVADLEQACPEGVLKTAQDEDYVPDFASEFELFQRTFAQHYAFFELRGVDWEAQVQEGRDQLSADMSVEEFFEVLTASVAPLEDGHVYIEAGEGLSFNVNHRADITTQLTLEALAQDDVPDEGVDEYVESYVEEQFEVMGQALLAHFAEDSLHGTLEDPVAWALIEDADARYGYFRISAFANIIDGSVDENVGSLHDDVEAALADWGDVDGVILDVRINEGGWDVLGRALMSHFVEEETAVCEKRAYFEGAWSESTTITVAPFEGMRYDGPVVVLSSRTTISAAETFVLSMRALDQVTVIGEATFGILSDSLPKFLPSGVYFSLSNEEYASPDGEIYERAGVPADVDLPVFSLEDRQAGRDASIEAALLSLRGE